MFDILTKTGAEVAMTTRTINSNTTTNGAIIDLKNADGQMFAITTGTITDGSYAINVQQGDAADLSDATNAVPAVNGLGDLLGDLTPFGPTDDNIVRRVGYIGAKRYIRLQLVSTGVTTGGQFTADSITGKRLHQPV